jgi:hypothetical protein
MAPDHPWILIQFQVELESIEVALAWGVAGECKLLISGSFFLVKRGLLGWDSCLGLRWQLRLPVQRACLGHFNFAASDRIHFCIESSSVIENVLPFFF